MGKSSQSIDVDEQRREHQPDQTMPNAVVLSGQRSIVRFVCSRRPSSLQSSVRTKSGPLTAIYKTYKGGGYVVSLGRTFEKANRLLNDLREKNWLDQFTRAVIVDFSLYNANVNLFSAVTLTFEMTAMGSVIQDYQIKVFRLYDHVGGFGVIVYAFELIFVLFTIYGIVHELLLIVKQRKSYFDKFWNNISFVTVLLSIAAILMYGTKKTLTRLAIRAFRRTDRGKGRRRRSVAHPCVSSFR